ncbi:hypothetical protein LJR168_003008 [Pseudoxanthomonas sp. LjRoot168]|uniref:hypothetical protein n=1 Tax=unclassified Pseudoxanthomonas TaxID=2645906 RepID=UPI003ECFBBFA
MFPVIAPWSVDAEDIFIVMAQERTAASLRFSSSWHKRTSPSMKISSSWHLHASTSKEIFLVMALKNDGDAPDRFAIDDIFLVMAQESPATVTASLIAEPTGPAGRPHDLRHLKVLTSGTSRQGGRVRGCA